MCCWVNSVQICEKWLRCRSLLDYVELKRLEKQRGIVVGMLKDNVSYEKGKGSVFRVGSSGTITLRPEPCFRIWDTGVGVREINEGRVLV